ncbi:hypothetical protein POTOM_003801 [Populus tomentosa]|uniref:Uncharacterized protein n=1 Tax=Populus tomentosa TaxID=118781 RepID=A0A8X8AG43_POPTO|nr:hypothetical protein POTOM_003801 [Populus tomentosa]
MFDEIRENALELLQRYRRDRRVLLDYMLSGSLIKKVVMPPGAVTLDDVDLDQVSVDYVLNCVKKGGMLELSEAIRDYHDNTGLPHMDDEMCFARGSVDEFFLVTKPETSGSPPKRAPPPVPISVPNPVFAPSPVVSLASVAKSESFNSTEVQELTDSNEVRELTVDDIEDFEDDDDLEVVDSARMSRRNPNDAADLVPKLPSFSTGITDDDLRETAYEVLLACAGASGGLIVPSKEKKKDKRSKLMRKLGRGKTENAVTHSHRATGLVGLLENMRAQMEIVDFQCVKYDNIQSPLRKSYRVISWELEVRTYAMLKSCLKDLEGWEFLKDLQISEVMDIRTRQGLLNALAGKVGKRMDTLLVPLELLCCISTFRISDKKAYIPVAKKQDSSVMEDVVLVAMITRRLLLEESEMAMQRTSVMDHDQIESFIASSIKNAFTRILVVVDKLDAMDEHPLALLAEEIKKLLKKESTIFTPILSQRNPQAIVVSASLVHKLYGNKLKPFLDGSEHLTEDVVSVFPAADSLEQYIMALITNACGEGNMEVKFRKLTPYQIESISGTLVMRWVNSQLGRILGWVERTIQQERWEPISPQQRHGSSIVEVYRIVEETVDQFFSLKVPMSSKELNGLFRGVDNAFQVYANHVTDKLAAKEDLIPPVPILTRYRKEAGIKAFVKKELFDSRMPEEIKSNEINVPATATLCVQLNTLYYAISQLNKLEDSIWERWNRRKPREQFIKKSIDENSASFKQKGTFDGSRKDINAAMDRICEFTGTKIIFYDLKEPFIENLYKPTVPQSRLEAIIEPLDIELNELCGIIVEPLRDHIVTSLLQASLDGFLRVILDGGPSRYFCPGDAKILEDDVEVLKEFFISGGDGLPRGVVENHVARARHVIKLHSYETRELIEDLKSVSGVERQRGGSRLGADTPTLLRILCHRSDSEASQFLKKQFKIPKSSV